MTNFTGLTKFTGRPVRVADPIRINPLVSTLSTLLNPLVSTLYTLFLRYLPHWSSCTGSATKDGSVPPLGSTPQPWESERTPISLRCVPVPMTSLEHLPSPWSLDAHLWHLYPGSNSPQPSMYAWIKYIVTIGIGLL